MPRIPQSLHCNERATVDSCPDKTDANPINDDIELGGIKQEEIYSRFAESEGYGHWSVFHSLVARDGNSPVAETVAMANESQKKITRPPRAV